MQRMIPISIKIKGYDANKSTHRETPEPPLRRLGASPMRKLFLSNAVGELGPLFAQALEIEFLRHG